MNDFRINAVKKAVNELGWTCESYDDSTSVLTIKANGRWLISFSDKREVVINVPVIELPDYLIQSGKSQSILNLANQMIAKIQGNSNLIVFDIISNIIVAGTCMSNNIFSTEDFEETLKSSLAVINAQIVAGTRLIENIIDKIGN
jgi:hypothetical protein